MPAAGRRAVLLLLLRWRAFGFLGPGVSRAVLTVAMGALTLRRGCVVTRGQRRHKTGDYTFASTTIFEETGMQIRKRNGRAVLWRTSWVPKGAEGNTHGYRTEKYVASLPLAATELPADLAGKLRPEEKVLLEARVFEPARIAAAERERAAAAHEADPAWRIEDALRLLDEAFTRSHESHGAPVSPELLARLHDAIARWPARPTRSAPLSGSARSEPNVLQPVIAAMEHAASAVRAGALGAPTAGKVRTTPAYRAWSDISAHVLDGKREGTLLRALQDAGVVKRRGTR